MLVHLVVIFVICLWFLFVFCLFVVGFFVCFFVCFALFSAFFLLFLFVCFWQGAGQYFIQQSKLVKFYKCNS